MASDIWPIIHAERKALAADLDGISAAQWELPTMCDEWNVHQVLAHCLSAAKMTPPKFLVNFAAAGFNFDTFAGNQVRRESAGGPAATLDAFRAAADRTSAPPGPKDTWLGEAFVHSEDIRRPLGIKREYPLDAVARALRFYASSEPIIKGKSRVAGLTLEATDTDVTIGSGPVVEGPVLSLLLAASGRKAVLEELSGPGVETLRSRH
jgi:uncharacterized protein (TIGR03083 family)